MFPDFEVDLILKARCSCYSRQMFLSVLPHKFCVWGNRARTQNIHLSLEFGQMQAFPTCREWYIDCGGSWAPPPPELPSLGNIKHPINLLFPSLPHSTTFNSVLLRRDPPVLSLVQNHGIHLWQTIMCSGYMISWFMCHTKLGYREPRGAEPGNETRRAQSTFPKANHDLVITTELGFRPKLNAMLAGKKILSVLCCTCLVSHLKENSSHYENGIPMPGIRSLCRCCTDVLTLHTMQQKSWFK